MTTQLLTPDVVAARLGVTTKTLRTLPIKRVRIGKRLVRYRESDVEAYITKRAA